MTGREVLETLLARIADALDGVVRLSEEELRGWPKGPVSILKAAEILRPTSPARSATCDGCERRCHMPVELLDCSGEAVAFVFCDKRDDIGRVDVPIDRLRGWQSSGQALAAFLAARLGAKRAASVQIQEREWAVGVMRGEKKSAPVVLLAADRLMLKLAGHSVALADVLSLGATGLVLQRARLEGYVDDPRPGAEGRETPGQRRQRLRAELAAEKAMGTRNPAETVATADGISRQMLHKIVRERKP
jgi:hypothetical protein